MSSVSFINQFSLSLTGTNYGLMNQYDRANYKNGYLFTDIFNNTNYMLPTTTHGGGFYTKLTTSDIKDLSGLKVWIDASDTSSITLSTNSVVTRVIKIVDKTDFGHVYDRLLSSNIILTAFWPVVGYSLYDQEYFNTNYNFLSSTNRCIEFNSSNFLNCSSVEIDMYKPFSLYYVWKNNFVGELEKTMPFSFITNVSGVSSELIPNIAYSSNSDLIIGSRDSLYGFKINSLSAYNVNFSYPNIFEFVYTGSFVNSVTSQNIAYNGYTNLSSDGEFFVSDIFQKQYTSSIGYSGDNNTNSFLFGEMLAFDRILSPSERESLINTLFDKWKINLIYENYDFNLPPTSGGPFRNITYEDFSLLTSNFEIPVQSCVTMLTLSLSSFDESVSKIKKITYEYNDTYGEINTLVKNTLQIGVTGYTSIPEKEIKLLLKPSNTKFFDALTIKLSVIKFDGTVNKINVNGNITQCGIRDLHASTYLIDSQIIDNLDKQLLVMENKNLNQIFLTKIDTDLQKIYLSGGDLVELSPDSELGQEEQIITLAEIFEEEITSKPVFKVPFIRPPVLREINPIRPS